MTLFVVAGSLLLLLIAVLAILWPVLREAKEAPAEEAGAESIVEVDPLSRLEARRDSVYEAIRDLRFDYQVGKVSEADFQIFDSQLKAQAAALLQEIDALQIAEADSDLDARLEAEIIALRRNGHSLAEPAIADPAGATVSFCPQCGVKAQPGDRFCGRCGAALR